MTNARKHTIGLLQFEIQVNSEKNAIALQEKISHFCRKEFPDVLETSFNQFNKTSSSLVIDKLEIDLGKIGYDDFNLKFLTNFKKVLLQKLETLQLQTPDLFQEGRIIGKEKTDFHIIESFLLTGNLPWYTDASKIDLRRISKILIRKKNVDFINLIRLRGTDKNFQDRLGNLIPESYYKEFFALFSNRIIWKEDALLKQYLLLYRQFPFTTTTLKTFRLMLFASIIEVLSRQPYTENLQFETSVFNKLAYKLMISLPQLISKSILSLEKVRTGKGSSAEITQLSLFLYQFNKLSIGKVNEIVEEQDEHLEKLNEAATEKNSYLVFNSGLVLISPFLNELFIKLNLIKDGVFINEDAQIRAIHLLHYASTAKSGAPEYILLLNKILCGFPVDRPIPWFVNLSMKEKSETTRMITATITNWSALKNTSSSAFRTSFVQRKGILKKVENGWKLKVERTAYDVLLSKIPWQYEQINLAWMNSKIETLW